MCVSKSVLEYILLFAWQRPYVILSAYAHVYIALVKYVAGCDRFENGEVTVGKNGPRCDLVCGEREDLAIVARGCRSALEYNVSNSYFITLYNLDGKLYWLGITINLAFSIVHSLLFSFFLSI